MAPVSCSARRSVSACTRWGMPFPMSPRGSLAWPPSRWAGRGCGTVSARAAHREQRVLGDLEIIGRPAAAGDRMRPRGLVDAVFQAVAIDMHADRLADHKPLVERPAFLGLEPDQLGQPALELHRAARDAIGADEA